MPKYDLRCAKCGVEVRDFECKISELDDTLAETTCAADLNPPLELQVLDNLEVKEFVPIYCGGKFEVIVGTPPWTKHPLGFAPGIRTRDGKLHTVNKVRPQGIRGSYKPAR